MSATQEKKWQVTSEMNQTFHRTDVAHASPIGTTTPPRYLRCIRAAQLYVAFPELGALTIARPHSGETLLNYFNRLRVSATPEEAVTLSAFAPRPQMAIWWAHESLRLMPAALSDNDAKLLEQIGRWVTAPTSHLGQWISARAMAAEELTPTVRLGRATGWSGVTSANPNAETQYLTPPEINTAVLATLAKAPVEHRVEFRNHILDLADCLFRAY